MTKHRMTCMLFLVFGPLSAIYGNESPGISVYGAGEVRAKPPRVEIALTAGAGAELTGDALVKYQDSLRRTLTAFDKLEIKDLKVEQRGLSFASSGGAPAEAYAAAVPGTPAGKAKIDISRSLRVVLAHADKLPEEELTSVIGKLLDAAKDAGAKVGEGGDNALLMRMIGQTGSPTPVVTFVVEDAQQAREDAYQQAFAQAKARATRLARLAGVELGLVESIEEGAEPTNKKDASVQEQMMSAIYGIGGKSSEEETRLTSDQLTEIPVRVTLRVRFSLERKAKQP